MYDIYVHIRKLTFPNKLVKGEFRRPQSVSYCHQFLDSGNGNFWNNKSETKELIKFNVDRLWTVSSTVESILKLKLFDKFYPFGKYHCLFSFKPTVVYRKERLSMNKHFKRFVYVIPNHVKLWSFYSYEILSYLLIDLFIYRRTYNLYKGPK